MDVYEKVSELKYVIHAVECGFENVHKWRYIWLRKLS